MAENTLDVRLLHAAKTLDDWNNVTTIPKLGEVCLEIQGNTPPLNYKIKIGDGSSTYAALPYFGTVVNTSGNASVVVVDTITDGSVTRKVLKFYKFTLTTSTVNGVTTITPTIGDLILTVQEGDGINFSTNTTDTLVNVELEATTADTAQTIADGGTFTTITKDSNNRATKYTTFTLPSITNKINTLDVADNTVITAEWDSTNKQIKLYYVKETDGIIQKGSLAYTINSIDIAPLQNITTTDTGNSGLEITTSNNVKDVHHKAVTQNIVDNSSVVGEKELNVITNVEVDSYGHITGYTKDKSTNLVAADIKAPVRQSDDSMWNHRVTGGTINIGEDAAKISKLRGNTLVWNQRWMASENRNDTIGQTYNGVTTTFDSTNNTYHIQGTADGNYDRGVNIPSVINEHVYLYKVSNIQSGSTSNVRSYIYAYGGYMLFSGQIGKSNTSNTVTCYVYVKSGEIVNFDFQIKLIDLTKMFGSDDQIAAALGVSNLTDSANLTLAAENFEKLFPNSYYPYNEGELISLKPTGVKSVGFNQWDEEWELGEIDDNGQKISAFNRIRSANYIHVVPSARYFFRCPKNTDLSWVFCYNSNKDYLGHFIYENYTGDGYPFTTLPNTEFILFCCNAVYGNVYNHDLCINLSDPNRNGTYEPYKESTLNLSWIKSIKDSDDNQLFPYGLLSAGSVHDEVGDNYAVKRIGSVNLGSLTYNYDSEGYFYTSYPLAKSYGQGIVSNGYTVRTSSVNPANMEVGQIVFNSFHVNKGLNVKYLEGVTDHTVFESAMSGVMLYYELAEPITVYFDKKPMTYPVDDFGTETLLPECVDSTTGVPLSAPFNGTFEYKSNFKDTVLDLIDKVNNARNPVKGITNTNQTVDKLAIYDSVETVKSSNYSPSNADIDEGATDNDIILPSVEAIVNYVNSKLASALNYKGTISQWSDLPTSGQNTGDMYIAATTFTEGSTTYQAGDFFIWNGTSWDIVSGTTSVVNSNPTLTPNGNTYQVGTVDGRPLQVTTPNLNYPSNPISSDGQSIEFIDTVSQNNGLLNATKKRIPTTSTAINGTSYDILVPPSTSLWSSIYAPTAAGTNGQILKSNGIGAPTWTTLSLSDLSLYSKKLSYKLNSSTATELGTIIRDANNDLILPEFYAPITAGNQYNLLMSNGSGAPSWTTFLSADNGYLKKTANGGWSLDPYGGGAKESVMNDGTVITVSSSATAGLRKQTGTNTYEYQKISFAAITNDTATGNNAVTIILNGNFN